MRCSSRLFAVASLFVAACADDPPSATPVVTPPAGAPDASSTLTDGGAPPPTEKTTTDDPPPPPGPPKRGDVTTFSPPGAYSRVTGIGLLGDTLYLARFLDLGQGDQNGEPSLWTCSVKDDCKTLTQTGATMAKRSPWAITKSGPDLFVYGPILDLKTNKHEILRIQPDGTMTKTVLTGIIPTEGMSGLAVVNGAALFDGEVLAGKRQTLVSLADGSKLAERTSDGNAPDYKSFATPSRLFTIDRKNATASSALSVVNPSTGARTTYLDGKISVAFAFGERVVGFDYTRATATIPDGIFACESDTSCSAPIRGTYEKGFYPSLVVGPVGDELLFWGLDVASAAIQSCKKAELLGGTCTPTQVAPTAPKKRGELGEAPLVAYDAQWLFYVAELGKIARVRLSVP